MVYETLKKIYYTAPLKIEDVYQSRYNAPFTRHFPFRNACIISLIGLLTFIAICVRALRQSKRSYKIIV